MSANEFSRIAAVLAAAVFLLLSAQDAAAMRVNDISERTKLCYNRPDPRLDKVQAFIKAADQITYSLAGLKPADKPPICSVILTDKDMKDGFEIDTSGNVLRIFVSENLSGWEKNFGLHTAVVSAMLLSRFGMKPDADYGKVPAWLAVGILSKIELRRNPHTLSGVNAYPGTRAMLCAGTIPDIWRILNAPLGYGDGPSYGFYSETCALVLDSVAKMPSGKGLVATILKSAVSGEKPDTAFKTAISDYITKSGLDFSTLPLDGDAPEKKVEAWFETAARNSSINMFFPGDSAYVEKRLDALNTLRYRAVPAADAKDKAAKPEIKSCGIRELGKKWDEIDSPVRVANVCIRSFGDLANQSPPILQGEINRVATLISRVKEGGRDSFEKDFSEIGNSLREKIARLKKIEDSLRECEMKNVPFGKRYSAELKYLEEAGTFTSRFCPALNAILDKEERNF